MDKTKDELRNLLASPEFMDIWARMNERYLSWNELQSYPMPPGYSPEEVWGVVSILNRRAGMVVPYDAYLPGAVGKQVWIARTDRFEDLRSDLAERTGKHSLLWHEIKENCNGYYRRGLVMGEALSVLYRDGIDIEPDRARGLWSGRTAPSGSAEKIFLALLDMFAEIDTYGRRRFGPGLIETIYEDLCDRSGLDYGQSSFAPRPRLDRGFFKETWSVDRVFFSVCALAEAGMRGGKLDPFVATLNLTALFWDWLPFPQLNAAVGFLMQAIFCQRAGIPAFAYIPISSISGSWEAGGGVLRGYRTIRVRRDNGQRRPWVWSRLDRDSPKTARVVSSIHCRPRTAN